LLITSLRHNYSSFQLSFDVGIVTIFGGQLDERRKAELSKNYSIVEKGYNSFPNSFPGTLYYKAIQVSTLYYRP
jgi:(+)-abscisic acid 8'-hydroxylase